MATYENRRVWSVTDAQAQLPELLRLAEVEGPQYIGGGHTFVVTSADPKPNPTEHRQSLGQWLVDNIPRGTSLDIPGDRRSQRPVPFAEPKDE